MTKKRVLATVLAMCLVCGVCPGVSATEEDEDETQFFPFVYALIDAWDAKQANKILKKIAENNKNG